jgi:hypothetical protein
MARDRALQSAILSGGACFLAASIHAQDPPQPVVYPNAFLGDLETARAQSLERNALLAVAIVQDGEEANDRFRDGVLRSAAFVKAAADVVLIVVNDGDHAPREIEEKQKDGQSIKRSVCSAYGTPGCMDHRRQWELVYREYKPADGLMPTPSFLIVLPDRSVDVRLVDVDSPVAIASALDVARKKAGPSLTSAQVDEVKRLLAVGREAGERLRWVDAWRSYAAAAGIASAGVLAVQARAAEQEALAALRARMDQATGRMQAGQVAEGYAALVLLRAECARMPLEKEVQRVLASAEKNPAWKPAIADWRAGVESEALWKEIEALLEQGKESAAQKAARKLLRKYPRTNAAERVRQRFPDLLEADAPRAARLCVEASRAPRTPRARRRIRPHAARSAAGARRSGRAPATRPGRPPRRR